MTKRGHNAIKGKQGFQPIRLSPPPTPVGIPDLPPPPAAQEKPFSTYTGPGADNSIENSPIMRYSEIRPAQVHIDNYTWGHAFLNSSNPAEVREKVERYGSRIAIAAYGAKLDKAIETTRGKELNAEFHKSISGDLNGAARLIIDDKSGRYSSNVVAAAERIHRGHIGDGRLNPHAIEVENASDTPDAHTMVFSKDAIAVLQSASGEARNPDERTKALIEENQNLAAEHKKYFRDPARVARPMGANLDAFPKPSEALVKERKQLVRTQTELGNASADLSSNRNPFARKRKETAVRDLQNKISRISDRLKYLERE